MMALRALPSASAAAPLRRAGARVQKRALAVRMRAEAEQTPAAPAAEQAAPAAPAAPQPVPVPVVAASTPAAAPGFFDMMAISAPIRTNVPFAVNARLAMIGVLSALGCELFTHKSVFEQYSENSGFVWGFSLLIAAASFAPILRGANTEEAFGPLTPRAERFNGEAAILGFFSLLVLELAKGSSLL